MGQSYLRNQWRSEGFAAEIVRSVRQEQRDPPWARLTVDERMVANDRLGDLDMVGARPSFE